MLDKQLIRSEITQVQRAVIKLGARVLTNDEGGLALSRLTEIIEEVVQIRRRGIEPLIVSSGAVGLGRDVLGLESNPTDLVEKQLCAAVGQSRLMEIYQQM